MSDQRFFLFAATDANGAITLTDRVVVQLNTSADALVGYDAGQTLPSLFAPITLGGASFDAGTVVAAFDDAVAADAQVGTDASTLDLGAFTLVKLQLVDPNSGLRTTVYALQAADPSAAGADQALYAEYDLNVAIPYAGSWTPSAVDVTDFHNALNDGVVTGTAGDDVISIASGYADASDADTISGNQDEVTDWGDIIIAGDGDDYVDAAGGNNTVDGGMGNDTLIGAAGHESLVGGDGDDRIDGGSEAAMRAGMDSIYGGAGADTISGIIGADLVDAGAGDDVIELENYYGRVYLMDSAGAVELRDSTQIQNVSGGDGTIGSMPALYPITWTSVCLDWAICLWMRMIGLVVISSRSRKSRFHMSTPPIAL